MRNTIGFVVLIFFIILIVLLVIYEPTGIILTYTDITDAWEAAGKIVTVIFTLTIIFVAVVIILENRNPSKTLAWLLVLLFLPVLGLILYLLFGINYRKRKLVKKKEIEILDFQLRQINDQLQSVSNDYYLSGLSYGKRLVSLLLKNSNSPFTTNNKAKVLTDGEEKFTELIDDLKNAQDHIHLEYFIIRDDILGKRIQKILIDKARKGVTVRLIYDGVGSRSLGVGYLFELKNAGAEVVCFLPVVLPFFHSKMNFRNHRKIIVIDGKVGYVGGLNIGDEYLGISSRFVNWRDTHLKLEGESVYFLQNIFIQDWSFAGGQEIKDREKYFPPLGYYDPTGVQIATSGPDSDWEAILQAYFTLISSAEKKIYITTPYFIPDDSILMALKTAALSGIDVRLIVPGKPDKRIVYWASHSYFDDLLAAGVKIYKYYKGFIHAKVVLIDDIVSSIGTANMNSRSFQLDFEVNALIYDEEIYNRLESDFLNDLEYCKELSLEEFRARSLLTRFNESWSRLFSPLI